MNENREIKNFVKKHEKKMEPLYKRIQLSWWGAYTTGRKEYYKRYEKSILEFRDMHSSPEELGKIKAWMRMPGGRILKRQLRVMYHLYLGSQGDRKLVREIVSKESAVEEKFNSFRASISGRKVTENDISDVLHREMDSEKLRKAWEASKVSGQLVEKEVLEIVRLRNTLAKSLGFSNYYQLAMELNEQKEGQIAGIFDRLEKLTRAAFRNLKSEMDSRLAEKYGVPPKDLRPWHYQNVFFQKAPEIYDIDADKLFRDRNIIEISRKFYSSIGMPVDDILRKSSLYEKKGKSQHAFCTSVDRKNDIRIILNAKNNAYWMGVTLHELGHAVYNKYIDKGLPFLLRDDAHTFATEAIALFFENVAKSPSFISAYCGADAAKYSEQLREAVRAQALVFCRWSLVMLNFERSMYRNPEKNLNRLWWKLVRKYQMINFSRNRPDWASKIHVVSSPVYYHNYMLGELFAAQIRHFIAANMARKGSSWEIEYPGNRRMGGYLKKRVFAPGRLYRWDEFVEKATGEKLSPRRFAEEFVRNR